MMSEPIRVQIEVPAEFVRGLLENLPEYAISFTCTHFDYEKCEFKLKDCETGKVHLLTERKARKGFVALVKKIFAGELPGLSVSDMNVFEPGNWDAYDTDALLQMALLGEIVYG